MTASTDRNTNQGWWIIGAGVLFTLWLGVTAMTYQLRMANNRHDACLAAIVDYQDSYQAITSSLNRGPAPARSAVQLKADTDRDVAACRA